MSRRPHVAFALGLAMAASLANSSAMALHRGSRAELMLNAPSMPASRHS